jgi:uncharacterized membrane protein YoaK (UPF0700 family)
MARGRADLIPDIIRNAADKLWEKTFAAFLLSCVAGLVDAVGYIRLYHIFTGFMGGNTITMAVGLGLGVWKKALVYFVPIAFFLLGVGSGYQLRVLLKRVGIKSQTAVLLALEAVLIGAYIFCEGRLLPRIHLGAGWSGFWWYVLLIALLATAMGIQNAGLHRVGGHSVHTTFMTGTLTRFARQSTTALRKTADGKTGERIHSPDHPLWLALLYLLYVAGATAGAFGVSRWGQTILFAAIGLLAIAIALDLASPLPSSGEG